MSTTWYHTHTVSRENVTATEQGANLPNPLRVLREEQFKRMHFLRNTFDIVETVDANDNLDAFKALLHLLYPADNLVFLQVLRMRIERRSSAYSGTSGRKHE
jgi:hypothetical protein